MTHSINKRLSVNAKAERSVRSINLWLMVACSAFTSTLGGCINEDLSDCEKVVTVTLKTSDPADESSILDATLYAFDSEGKFVESRPTTIGQKEVFNFPTTGSYTFVGWCNTSDGKVTVTQFTSGKNINQGMVSLVGTPVTEPSVTDMYLSPGDLFQSATATQSETLKEDIVVVAFRRVASMNVTVRSLKAYAGFPDNNYSIVVGTTNTQLDFTGEYSGSNAGYFPATSFNTSGEFATPTYNLFPSLGQTLYIKLYHANALVYQTTTNSNGTPLQAVANETLNVLIDFALPANIDVRVVMSQWGEVHEWEKIIR